MILVFDVGNTNIKIGIADAETIQHSFTLSTALVQVGDSFALQLLALLQHAAIGPADISACLASSVVPNVNPLLSYSCERFLHKKLLFISKDIMVPLRNIYKRPQEVGADRLVASYCARSLYPEPEALISVDFGTATTFDCIRDTMYLGGLICPGVESAARALASGTAKLPPISLTIEEGMSAFGSDTSTSLNLGFVYGFASLTEGLCAKLIKEFGCPATIVATGGFARTIASVSDIFDAVVPELVLEGLRRLYYEFG